MEHTLPPLEALQAVLSAATTGSFSAAADVLGVTHGAISRRVSIVEKWAGVVIFVRHGRGVRSTLEGQRVLARIEQALVLLDDTKLGAPREAEPEMVRVGVVQSFARLWLIPRLRQLEGDPRDLRIEPEIDHRHMTLSDARIAIRLGRGDWPGVVATRLFEEQLQPFANAAIAERLGPDADPDALLSFPLIHDASDEKWRVWLGERKLDRRGRDRTFAGFDLALLAAAGGHGIVLGRDPYGKAYREALGLVPVTMTKVASPQAFYLVVAPGRRHDAVDRLSRRLLSIAAAESHASVDNSIA